MTSQSDHKFGFLYSNINEISTLIIINLNDLRYDYQILCVDVPWLRDYACRQ